MLPNAHQEIIGLDITVDEITRMNILDTRYLIEIIRKWTRTSDEKMNEPTGMQVKEQFQAELATTEIEKIFERRTKEVKDHSIVIAFCTKPLDEWDTNATCKSFVVL